MQPSHSHRHSSQKDKRGENAVLLHAIARERERRKKRREMLGDVRK
jgi:hypothetical protein